jgi:uncharacterized Zn finger protein (UPF0148 family)
MGDRYKRNYGMQHSSGSLRGGNFREPCTCKSCGCSYDFKRVGRFCPYCKEQHNIQPTEEQIKEFNKPVENKPSNKQSENTDTKENSMSNFEITGKVILKEDTKQVSDKFKKREFVIEVVNERNEKWNDFIKFQLTQDRCDLLETVSINETIKVSFNIKGRKWEKDGKVNYFSNLEAWRIEKMQATASPEFNAADMPPAPEEDDLPF